MLDPKLLILDEPSMGLDPKTHSVVFELIRDMNRSAEPSCWLNRTRARARAGQSRRRPESGRVRSRARPSVLAMARSVACFSERPSDGSHPETCAAGRTSLAAAFVANGIDVNDFDDVLARTQEWADWGPNWLAMGAVHEDIGHDARIADTCVRRRRLPAAAWCYHLGKFLWFEDLDLHATLRDQAVSVYRRHCLTSIHPLSVSRFPSRDTSSRSSPASARCHQATPGAHRAGPGLLEEEMFTIEEEFLRRGMATLSIEGPGQSENRSTSPSVRTGRR